jgi:hypothetical protein
MTSRVEMDSAKNLSAKRRLARSEELRGAKSLRERKAPGSEKPPGEESSGERGAPKSYLLGDLVSCEHFCSSGLAEVLLLSRLIH